MQTVPIDRLSIGDPARSFAVRVVETMRVHRGLVAVLALGLVIRLVVLASSASTPLQVVDEQHYAQLASNLVNGHGFAWGDGQPTSMRPPLYPAFVASIWTVTGHESLQAVRAAQVALALAVVVLVYFLAAGLFDRRTALLAAALFCFYPSFVFSGMLLLTEVLFTLLLVAMALLFHRLTQRPQIDTAAATGFVLGLAALTRSVLWPFPLVLVPLTVVVTPGSWRRRLITAGAIVVGYAAVVTPWALRNTHLQGTLSIVDTMGGMNLRMGNYEHTPEDRMWDAVSLTGEKNWAFALGAIGNDSQTWTDGQKEKWAQQEALAYMVAHPGTTLRRSVLKFADFWGLEREMIAGFSQGLYRPSRVVMVLASVAVLLTYPLVALAAATGMFRARPSNPATHALLVLVILFVTGIHSVVFGHSRYHLPLIAFLAIYAAAAVSGRTTLATARWRTVGAAVTCAALLGVWCYEVAVRDADRIRTVLGAWL